tara:strand:- start:1522 stop:1683 length:162 start_codon:yes stop_codon:yes gene_type:complete
MRDYMVYKTKTQKGKALRRVETTAMKLFMSGAISMKDADAISRIVNMRIKQLK